MDIVSYRAAFGVSESVSESFYAKGISVALIENSRDSVTVDTDPDSDC